MTDDPLLRRLDALSRRLDQLEAAQTKTADDLIGELAALMQIQRVLPPALPVPSAGGFAVAPRTITELMRIVSGLTDPVVVECGSGSSTMLLGLACRMNGSGRVVALEHDDHFGEQTRRLLVDAGLEDWAEVRTAPLEPVTVDGEQFRWYAAGTWQDLSDVDVLFVDGPPGSTGPRARFPALPLLQDSVRTGGWVVLDDTHRSEERAIATAWRHRDDRTVTPSHVLGRTTYLRRS